MNELKKNIFSRTVYIHKIRSAPLLEDDYWFEFPPYVHISANPLTEEQAIKLVKKAHTDYNKISLIDMEITKEVRAMSLEAFYKNSEPITRPPSQR